MVPSNLTEIEAASFPYVVSTVMTALCDVGELKQSNTANKRYTVKVVGHLVVLTSYFLF